MLLERILHILGLWRKALETQEVRRMLTKAREMLGVSRCCLQGDVR